MRWWRRTQVEKVKGGALEVGDIVLVPCKIESINRYNHVIATPELGTHWHVGDQELWTWGGKYGAGKDIGPDIFRVVES